MWAERGQGGGAGKGGAGGYQVEIDCVGGVEFRGAAQTSKEGLSFTFFSPVSGIWFNELRSGVRQLTPVSGCVCACVHLCVCTVYIREFPTVDACTCAPTPEHTCRYTCMHAHTHTHTHTHKDTSSEVFPAWETPQTHTHNLARLLQAGFLLITHSLLLLPLLLLKLVGTTTSLG